MPLTNVRQVSHSLVFRYQQNLPNLFCSCSQHNRGYFIIIIFFIFACVCFSGQRRQARSELGAPETRGGKALHALFTLALTCKRQTYFQSSLLSLRSDDRKYVCCSQAALAFARLKNAKKKNACCAGYHSWAEIKGGIYEKQKNKKKPTGKKRRSCLLKKQNVF